MRRRAKNHLLRNSALTALSIVLTYLLMRASVFDTVVSSAAQLDYLGSFVAGIFFTSVFTIAPAAVVLGKLAGVVSPLSVAIFGAFGAMLGDTLLFLFVQDVFSGDIHAILKDRRIVRLFRHFHFHFWKWVLPVIGAIVIISPLPDEIGLTMLGLSRVRTIVMLPLTFALNFIGILLIAFLANGVH